MTNKKDAHIIALEWLKHLITLSSSIIVFSGTFVGAVLEEPNWSLWILGVSWVLFVAVIMLSLETISAITYSRINDDESWTKGKGEKMARWSKYCFVAGAVSFVAFAGINIALRIFNTKDATQAILFRLLG